MKSIGTKELIATTLRELLQNKNLDKITVKDLVGACNISRQTFYYHFKDIMDVVEWIVQKNMECALEKSRNVKTAEEAMLIFVSDMRKDRVIITKMGNSARRRDIEKLVVKKMHIVIKKLMLTKVADKTVNLVDLEMAMEFYAYGFTGYMFKLCEEGDIDEQRVAKQISLILNGQMNVTT